MKKLAFLLIMALGTLTASAQKTPHAIGAHFGGSTIDLEYQYHFSKRNFLDLTAGVFNLSDGFALQAFTTGTSSSGPAGRHVSLHGNCGAALVLA